jgi:hypothetical protein
VKLLVEKAGEMTEQTEITEQTETPPKPFRLFRHLSSSLPLTTTWGALHTLIQNNSIDEARWMNILNAAPSKLSRCFIIN